MKKITIGIAGYGNLGRGAELAAAQNPDMELRYIFTRRDPPAVRPVSPDVKVLSMGDAPRVAGELDAVLLCGGSATDLPEQTPELAQYFNVVDSFDTHSKTNVHFEKVDAAAKAGGKVAVISAGWDPGLFSLERLIGEAVLPRGSTYTFWGRGVSQGHSDAIRRVAGVADARQYSIPVQSSLDAVRRGETPVLSARERILRECVVVAEEGADLARIEREIKQMPDYFADYDTTVHFISAEELEKNHSAMPHGGNIIRSGRTGQGGENGQTVEYALRLGSNPEFTAGVLVACARAAVRMNGEGASGCKTVFDIPPAYYLPCGAEELRRRLL